jgi:hypothetical protein
MSKPGVRYITREERRALDRALQQERPAARTLASVEAELATARQELQSWEERWDQYNGNNPNKYATDLRRARQHVQQLETELKRLQEKPAQP